MVKKLLLGALLAVFLSLPATAVESIFFGTVNTILDFGSEEKIGVGGAFDVGLPIGDQVILRGTYQSVKSASGMGWDNGFTGLTIISGEIIPAIRAGLYLTAEGGISKVPGTEMEFATLGSMGIWSAVGKKTKLWLGAGYSEVANKGQLWSINFSLSIQAPLE